MVAKKIHQHIHTAARHRIAQLAVTFAAILLFVLLLTSSCQKTTVSSVQPTQADLTNNVISKPVPCSDYDCAAQIAQTCNSRNPVWMDQLQANGSRQILAFSGWLGDSCIISKIDQKYDGSRTESKCQMSKSKMANKQNIVTMLEQGCESQ